MAYKSAMKAIRLLQIYCGEMARYEGYYKQGHPEMRVSQLEKRYAGVYEELLQAKEIYDLNRDNYC